MLTGILNKIPYHRVTNALRKYLGPLVSRSEYYENDLGTRHLLSDLNSCKEQPLEQTLLQKASIVTTPTAYDNGSLHSVKPVQSFGPELVTNGDFSNGLSNWSYFNASLVDGGVNLNNIGLGGQNTYIKQNDGYVIGNTYKLELDVINTNGADLVIENASNTSIGTQTIGRKIVYFTQVTTNEIAIKRLTGDTNVVIDNLSVKEVIDADFDFTRGSAATRVDENFLVKNVQILSDELVQNGDFEEIGPEEVTNGSFDTNITGWVRYSNTLISWESGGYALLNSNNNYWCKIQQSNVFEIGKTYKVILTAKSDRTDLSFHNSPIVGNFSQADTFETFDQYYTATTTDFLFGYANAGNSTITIDNVSVKEVGQNWTFNTGWSYGDGKAISTNSTNSNLENNSISIANGKQYKFTFEITDFTGNGFVRPQLGAVGAVVGTYVQGNGVYSQILIANNNFDRIVLRTGGGDGFNGSIDNISVIEVTDDTDLPRIDYTNGTGSLLLEPQSTNLVTYSEDFSQWSTLNGSSVDLNFAISPDGTQNASKFNFNGTTNGRVELQITGLTPAQPVTFSVWLKTLSGTEQVYIGHSSFGLKEVTVTDQWQRYTSSTISGAGGFAFPRVRMDSASSVLVWGYQVEELSYATSYIPTSGSTVTRNADACKSGGSSDLINSTEGVLYAEIAALANDGTNRRISITDGTGNNRINISYHPSTNYIQSFGFVNGVLQFNFTLQITPSITSFNKIAVKFKENDAALWLNGVEIATDNSVNTWANNTLNDLSFANNPSSTAESFYGRVRSVAVFKEALTDEELACLTSHKQDTSFYYYVQKLKFIEATLEHFGEFYNKFKKLF